MTLPARADGIEGAREAIARGDWKAARAMARLSLGRRETPEGHEILGLAAWWLSDAATLFAARERAFQLYRAAGNVRRAARVAAWLDWDYRAFRGEAAVASGWLRRARRLLEGQEDSVEFGWVLVRESDAELAVDARKSAADAGQAAELGRRLHDPDLEFIALSLQGLALVAAGDVPDGMRRLDEATAAVVAGEFSDPSAAGVTCCHLIAACELVRDFDRAGQWCDRVRDYCARWDHPPLFAVCRTQYAGVLVSRGAWKEAETELESAVDELTALRPGWIALGQLRLAELRRRQGRLDEAERLFLQFEHTVEAGLGLATIALDRHRPAEAERLARRVVRALPAGNHTARAAALETLVLAAAAAGRPRGADHDLAELERVAGVVGSEAIAASARLAGGAMAAAAGDLARARDLLEDAATGFDRASAPYDALRARLQLAEVLQSQGQLDGAVAEASSAHRRAVSLGAAHLVEQALTLQRTLKSAGGARRDRRVTLTRREREVLSQVAHGLTNRQIANRLGVSEHTVHRHLGNVFTKLGLSSRAAAVAYALRSGA
jgi:DNA-binding CsgD family transcriptional regulator